MSTDNLSATIELAHNGDTGAFAQIVRQYQSLVSGVLYSATGDFHKSEDLAQETFLIAWQKLGDLRETDHLAAWLCTIARNLVYRSHRKPTLPTQSLETVSHTDKTGGLAPSALVSTAHAPDAELLRREQSEFVWSAIGEIDEKHRETLVMYYRSGQSASEIAAAMDLTEEAVWQRLARARKSLKAKLEEMVGSILTDTAPSEAFTLTVMTALGAAMFTTATAQAAVVATTGTAAAGTMVATSAATGGKTLGTATIWSVLAPVALFGWFVAMFLAVFWAGVRNAPTLRARRFRVYSIFWSCQYYGLFSCILMGIASTIFYWFLPLLGIGSTGTIAFLIVFSLGFLVGFSFPLAYQRKMRRIVENDLGLPGQYVESYSYPQVERRFFLSLITNLLLAVTILAYFLAFAIFGDKFGGSKFWTAISVFIAVVVVITAVYYPLGRYLLETCRTKQNFLAAPPLVNNPFEVIFQKTGKQPFSVDHPKKTDRMFGVILLVWIGYAGVGVWYFSLYSWDKHPIALGICVALTILVFGVGNVLVRRMKTLRSVSSASILLLLCITALVLVLEYIEFGGFYFSDVWSNPRYPRTMIHVINLTAILAAALSLLIQLCYWFKEGKEERNDASTGRDELIREAIAQFDPVTMTADEPEVAAKPFPKRWMWIIGLYAAAIVVMWCVGVLYPL